MRTIERASTFKRDFKKVALSPRHRHDLGVLLTDVLDRLVQDLALDADTLRLARLGSHSELFG